MKKLIIIGAGGLGRETAQYINDINQIKYEYELLGYIDDDISKLGLVYNNLEVIGNTNMLSELNDIYLFCAVANPVVKKNIAQKIKKYGNKTINIIHPKAYVSPYINFGENVLVAPMCVLNTNITIGNYVHINPQCGIGHDAIIEDYTTLYWNVNISGFVHVGEAVELGSKTFIKQGLIISDKAISGAGAVIVKDVAPAVTVKGVPAI